MERCAPPPLSNPTSFSSKPTNIPPLPGPHIVPYGLLPRSTALTPTPSPPPFLLPTKPSRHSLAITRPLPGQRAPPIKTQARSATILPNFVGLTFQVHNGKIYNVVTVTEDMVGHKLGEFSAYVMFLFPSSSTSASASKGLGWWEGFGKEGGWVEGWAQGVWMDGWMANC